EEFRVVVDVDGVDIKTTRRRERSTYARQLPAPRVDGADVQRHVATQTSRNGQSEIVRVGRYIIRRVHSIGAVVASSRNWKLGARYTTGPGRHECLQIVEIERPTRQDCGDGWFSK